MEPTQRDWGRFLSNFNNTEFDHPNNLEPNSEQLNSIKLKLGTLFVQMNEIFPVLRSSEEAKQHLQEIINKSLFEVQSASEKNKQTHGEVITQLCQHIFQNVNNTIPNALHYPRDEIDRQKLLFLDQQLLKQSQQVAQSINEYLKNETRIQLSKALDPIRHPGYIQTTNLDNKEHLEKTSALAKDLQTNLRVRLQLFPTERPPEALIKNLDEIIEKQNRFELLSRSLVDKLHDVWNVKVPHSLAVSYFLDPKVSKEQRMAILSSGDLFQGKISIGDLSSMVAIIREQFTDDQLSTLIESGMDNSGLSKLLLLAYQELLHFEVKPSVDQKERNAQTYLLKKVLECITSMDSLIGIVVQSTLKPPAELLAFKNATVLLTCGDTMITFRYPEVLKLALISPVFDKFLHRRENGEKKINDEVSLTKVNSRDFQVLLGLSSLWEDIPKAVRYVNQLYQDTLLNHNVFSNYSTFKFFQLPPHLFTAMEARIDQKLDSLLARPESSRLYQLFFDQLLPCLESEIVLDLTAEQMEKIMKLYDFFLPTVGDLDKKINLYRVGYYFAQRLGNTENFIKQNEGVLSDLLKNLVEHHVTGLLDEPDYLNGLDVIKESYSFLQPFEGFEVKSYPLRLNLVGMPVKPEQLRQLKGLPIDEVKLQYSAEFSPQVREEIKNAFPQTRVEYVNLPFTDRLGDLLKNH